MPSLEASFPALFAALADHFAKPWQTPQKARSFELVIEVALRKTANVTGVDAAIDVLAQSGLLQPEDLAGADPRELIEVLGGASVKLSPKGALLLKRLAGWFATAFSEDAEPAAASSPPTSRLREGLLAIRGIGPATADAILLALGRPRYPVDHATYRILVRHGWVDPSAEYDEVHDLLTRRTREDPAEIARLSRWLVAVGRHYCGRSAPKCERCPLREFLPDAGPIEPDC
jgi:endonuclease-3 related protein